MQLKDQAAIVTGGASGLGAATARKLAAQGARVAVCDLNAKLAESVAAEIKGLAVAADVADAASAEAAVAQAARVHGPARVLVNCAGIGVAKRVVGRDGPHPLPDFREGHQGQPDRLLQHAAACDRGDVEAGAACDRRARRRDQHGLGCRL